MVAITGDAASLEVPVEADALAIQRMLDDGAPVPPRQRATRTMKTRPAQSVVDPSAAEQRGRGWAVRQVFRLYCFACGRSLESPTTSARPGRCVHCGGTMLRELTAD
jgi:hypothetical protein